MKLENVLKVFGPIYKDFNPLNTPENYLYSEALEILKNEGVLSIVDEFKNVTKINILKAPIFLSKNGEPVSDARKLTQRNDGLILEFDDECKPDKLFQLF